LRDYRKRVGSLTKGGKRLWAAVLKEKISEGGGVTTTAEGVLNREGAEGGPRLSFLLREKIL